MTRRNRIFAGILVAYAIGVALMLWRLIDDIDPRYRESAEESLVDTAHLLATLVGQNSVGGTIETRALEPLFRSLHERRFKANIYGFIKTQVEIRALVVDSKGVVLFDSEGTNVGRDFSRWRDVSLALRGQYGARTTRDDEQDPLTSVMYVTAPIRADGTIIGAATVGKPVRGLGQFIATAQRKTIVVGVISMAAMFIFILILSAWLVRPFGLIKDYAHYVRTERRLDISRLLGKGIAVLRTSFDEMRDALAGRSYVADYVQSLTHELKSPVSAIHGAAELLQEPMGEADRQRFVANIQRETQRIQQLVDRMMELSTIESRRGLSHTEPVALRSVLAELAASARVAGAARRIRIEVAAPQDAQIEGDPLLLSRAIGSLLDNAVDFSPDDGTVVISLKTERKTASVAVLDEGPGIPEYAAGKVFERFYSLERPHSKRKSSGLGLPFALQVAKLHGGRLSLHNRKDRSGAIATLTLPRH